MKTYDAKVTDNLLNAIQMLKDWGLKYAGNQALQPALDVQIWIQNVVQEAAKAEVKVADKKE
jgi:hypothetical protein